MANPNRIDDSHYEIIDKGDSFLSKEKGVAFMSLPYVYIVTHKESGQFYIGYRCRNNVPAELDLGIKYFTSSQKVAKLGVNNFDYRVLAIFFDIDDAYDFEQELIKEHLSNDLCLNGYYAKGGRFKHTEPHSEETKRKISDIHTGRKVSEETKAKLRKPASEERKAKLVAFYSEPNNREARRQENLGRRFTDEAKLKLAETNATDEVKQKRRLAQLGKKQSVETIAKRVEANTGLTRSNEVKAKISDGHSARNKTFRIVSPEGEVFIGKNLTKFCREQGFWPASLSNVCRGLKESYNGWTGEYIE